MTARQPVTHKLKIWPGDFEAVRAAAKTCEVRRCDDRNFRVGDVLELHEFDPNRSIESAYSGRFIRVRLTHVDRLAGPRMISGIGRASLDDVVPLAVLSFGRSIT
jgi:hypothetical protein